MLDAFFKGTVTRNYKSRKAEAVSCDGRGKEEGCRRRIIERRVEANDKQKISLD